MKKTKLLSCLIALLILSILIVFTPTVNAALDYNNSATWTIKINETFGGSFNDTLWTRVLKDEQNIDINYTGGYLFVRADNTGTNSGASAQLAKTLNWTKTSGIKIEWDSVETNNAAENAFTGAYFHDINSNIDTTYYGGLVNNTIFWRQWEKAGSELFQMRETASADDWALTTLLQTFGTAYTQGNLYHQTLYWLGNGTVIACVGKNAENSGGDCKQINIGATNWNAMTRVILSLHAGSSSFTDQLNIYNFSLYTNETGTPPSPPGDSINITSIKPINNSQFNSNPIFFNATVDATINFTIRLFINDLLNQTKTSNAGWGLNLSFNATFGASGTYTYRFTADTNDTNENSSRNTFHVDLINPTITVNTWVNDTLWYSGGGNITGKWNFTDDFYLHNYTIRLDGIIIDSKNDLNTTFYAYNLSYNPISLSSGNHNINITLSDGHTSNKLGGLYEWSNGLFNDHLTFEFYDYGFARIDAVDGSIFDTFTATKLNDRYSFSYEPSDTKKEKYVFEITSDMPISIASNKNTKWKTWLIMGNHWLDFYSQNEPEQELIISRIDKYTVRIEVSGLKNKELLEFNSIGDLNIVTQSYNFSVTNLTSIYSSAVNELEYQTIELRINKTSNVINSNAVLVWNNTVMNVVNTNYSDYASFKSTFLTPGISSSTASAKLNWSYTIIGVANNLTGLINGSQLIYQIGIDNCTNYNATAINWSIKNEATSLNINGSIDGYFQVWIDSISNYRAFNLSWAGASIYGVCINPGNATYNISTQLEYSASGDSTKNYYLTNTQIDNITEIINLYLQNDTTQVTFSVTDQDDEPIPDVYIHVQSYDLGTSSYKTTEIVKTDYKGEAFAQIQLYTQWYQFNLLYNDVLELTTSPTKITSTTLNFRIDTTVDILGTFNSVKEMTCALTFNNATNNFNFNFVNPDGTSVISTLNVYNQTNYKKELFNTSTQTSASGTLIVGIGIPKNLTYLGIGMVTINGISYSCGDPVSINFGGDHAIYGKQGIFLVFLLMITLVMIGIWSPSIAISLGILTIVISRILGIFNLSWAAFIAVIILGGITIYRINSR